MRICKKLNDELAKLYEKYGPDHLEITFIPFGRFSGIEEYLSRASMCVSRQDFNIFWKFHVGLINEIKLQPNLINSTDPKPFREIINQLLLKHKVNKSQFDQCLIDQNKKMTNLFQGVRSNYRFLENQELPIFILNNSKLDLEGRSLLSAFDDQIKK